MNSLGKKCLLIMNVVTKTTLIFNLLFFGYINEIIISILLLLLDRKKMTLHGDSQKRGLIMCSALVSLAYMYHSSSLYLLRPTMWKEMS